MPCEGGNKCKRKCGELYQTRQSAVVDGTVVHHFTCVVVCWSCLILAAQDELIGAMGAGMAGGEGGGGDPSSVSPGC